MYNVLYCYNNGARLSANTKVLRVLYLLGMLVGQAFYQMLGDFITPLK